MKTKQFAVAIAMLFLALLVATPAAFGQGPDKVKWNSGHVDLDGAVFPNYCNLELVQAETGWWEYRYKLVIKGDRLKFTSDYQAKGTGQGLVTGALYIIDENSPFREVSPDLDNGDFDFSGTTRIRLVTKGPNGEDMFFLTDFSLQYRNGILTSSVSNFRLDCGSAGKGKK